MSQLLSLFNITVKHTRKSYSFLILCGLAIIAPLAVPLILSWNSNEIINSIRVYLIYSLSISCYLIFISSLWTGCSIMAKDIESYRIHMIVTKSISKSKLYIGRFIGIFVIHFTVMIVVILIVYLVTAIIPIFLNSNQPTKEILKEEIFTGRKIFFTNLGNLNEIVNKEATLELEKTNKSENRPSEQDIKKRIFYSILTQKGEIKSLTSKSFSFDIDPIKFPDFVLIKFEPYIGSIDTIFQQNRKRVYGKVTMSINNGTPSNVYEGLFFSNKWYDIKAQLNKQTVINKITLTFYNLDKNNKLFFRVDSSPQVVIKYGSFLNNYLRYFLLFVIGLALMSALGCTFGGIFSFPIAIFILCAYLVSGTLGNFVISSNSLLENNSVRIKMGVFVSQTILKIISPIQKFQTSDYLANGILLNNNYILSIIEKFFIIQFIIVIALGIFIFKRRELGKVVKK